ncbi:MAG: ParB/RepB/Spo0J family partition protein [Candidatus Omnitrophota bacterium]
MAEKKALGRGLGALIPETNKSNEKVATVKTAEIFASKFQPREDFDPEKLNDLILSVRQRGVIQPVLVRVKGNGGYELIAGERRLRAAKAVGLEEIPAIIKNVTDAELLEISLIENVQRENLNPMEQAIAYNRLAEEFNLSHEEIATAMGKDRSTITNILRLLNLPDFVQKSVQKSDISLGHAKVLLSLNQPLRQVEICKRIINENLSVRQVESIVSPGHGASAVKKKKNASSRDLHVTAIEEELQRTLGTKVSIKAGKKRGTIKIEYYSNNDLSRILDVIIKKQL